MISKIFSVQDSLYWIYKKFCKNQLKYHAFFVDYQVHEVVDRVDDLQKNWPPEWGEVEGNIGVVAPYSDQVFSFRPN